MCQMCIDKMLLDHGEGPMVELFERGPGLCDRCNYFPAGGGTDGVFEKLCGHCFNETAELGEICPICAKATTH